MSAQPDVEVLQRTFEAQITEGDGRTLEARVVPYNVVAQVADPPDFRPYREMFIKGAFERQLSVPDRVRVWLNFEHQQGLSGIVGHGVELSEEPAALVGRFRVHQNADGDKALQLYHEGLLTGLSLEFASMRSRVVDGVTQRLRAHIHAVSLCRFPAYEGAAILAAREAPDEDDVEPDEPDVEPDSDDEPEPEPDPEPDAEPVSAEASRAAPMETHLVERLEALGIVPLGRISKTSRPWDGSPARFTDEQYARSALICRPNGGPPKLACSLPVLEPDGTLNVNALGPAAGALGGARGGVRNVSQAQKAAAARKLVRYYNALQLEVPRALASLARS